MTITVYADGSLSRWSADAPSAALPVRVRKDDATGTRTLDLVVSGEPRSYDVTHVWHHPRFGDIAEDLIDGAIHLRVPGISVQPRGGHRYLVWWHRLADAA